MTSGTPSPATNHAGGELYDLKEILGHSDIKMTARYAHLSPAHLAGRGGSP